MTKSEMAARLDAANAYLPGKRVKLDFGDEGVVMLDGVGNAVTEEDGAADTTIKVAWADWQDMADGKLDGMTAFMQGKLKVEGDMGNAMQLQGVLAKLQGLGPRRVPQRLHLVSQAAQALRPAAVSDRRVCGLRLTKLLSTADVAGILELPQMRREIAVGRADLVAQLREQRRIRPPRDRRRRRAGCGRG